MITNNNNYYTVKELVYIKEKNGLRESNCSFLEKSSLETLFELINSIADNRSEWKSIDSQFKKRVFTTLIDRLDSNSTLPRVRSGLALQLIFTGRSLLEVLRGDHDDKMLAFTNSQQKKALYLSEVFDLDYKARLLKVIEEKTGIRFSFEEPHTSLTFTVEDFSNIDLLDKYLSFLFSHPFRIDIKIRVSPSCHQNPNDVLLFAKKYSHYFVELNLCKIRGTNKQTILTKLIQLCSERLNKLHTLNVQQCQLYHNELENLSKITSLRKVRLSMCILGKQNLKSVCKLENLKSLDLSGSGSLDSLPIEIGNLSKLEKLHLDSWSQLSKIPNTSEELIHFYQYSKWYPCYYGSQFLPREIAQLKQLRVLTLKYWEKLKKLPEGIGKLTKLRELDFRYCKSLDELPNSLARCKKLKKLELFSCDSFPENYRLRFFLHLIANRDDPNDWVTFSKSLNLDNFFSNLQLKSRIQRCESKYLLILDLLLEYCINDIMRIPLIDCDKILDDLVVLEHIQPGEVRPLLLNYRNAIFEKGGRLKDYIQHNFDQSQYPELYPIQIEERDFWSFLQVTCSRYHLENEFIELIEKLGSRLIPIETKDIRVTYSKEKGVDDGGVRRDFISSLFQKVSLVYNFHKGLPGDNFPCYESLGKLIAWLIIEADGKYSIGKCFHESFYRGVLAFSFDEVNSSFDSIKSDRAYKIYQLYKKGDKSTKGGKQFIKWDGRQQKENTALNFLRHLVEMLELGDLIDLDFDCPDYSMIRENINQWKEVLYEEFFKNLLKPLHQIARGMARDRQQWKDLQKLGYAKVRKTLEGSFSKDELLQKIKLPDNFYDKATLEEQLVQWVEGHSEWELRCFLKCVTGAPSVPVGNDEITIVLAWTEKAYVQSCSYKISIPKEATVDSIMALLSSCIDEGKLIFDLE